MYWTKKSTRANISVTMNDVKQCKTSKYICDVTRIRYAGQDEHRTDFWCACIPVGRSTTVKTAVTQRAYPTIIFGV